eukprot:1065092-Rhodomonas_salina.4
MGAGATFPTEDVEMDLSVPVHVYLFHLGPNAVSVPGCVTVPPLHPCKATSPDCGYFGINTGYPGTGYPGTRVPRVNGSPGTPVRGRQFS